MNFLHKVFHIVLFFFGWLQSFCQSADSMAAKFTRDAWMQEKVYVHTDKETYFPGEVIWFKVYAVEGATQRPAAISKLAYVELLDKDQAPLLRGKVLLKEGMGSGSFLVPASAVTGNYLFRSYTSWMKNNGPDYFFNKSLTLV